MLARNFLPAKELGLSDLQRQALIDVLGLLERNELNEIMGDVNRQPSYDPLGFSMRAWGTCICGWANKLTNSRAFPRYTHQEYGRADLLFNRTGMSMEQAGIALRDFLTRGSA